MTDTVRKHKRHKQTHVALAGVWACLIPPTILWWKESITFLVFISVYAVIVSHWSAYESADD